ncbi:Protein ral2 [Cyphellophora attinorum]|uniref:Protein ral2 n=1 Tax=Cyphellophora attinorum TaxID=1664694 RepID=A0A0N1NYF3_9EURO|nr:Protein ral2 [Phialophora attinorum]KPI39707.1 Protein ral2 [Phialophora attinorum]
MARLRSKSSSHSLSSSRRLANHFKTSHLEPASPEDDPEPPTPNPRENHIFNSLLGFKWNKSTSTVSEISTGSKDDLPPLPPLGACHFPPHPAVRRATSPRHVPIIIPDFAHPFNRETKSLDAGVPGRSPVPHIPVLRREPRQIQDPSLLTVPPLRLKSKIDDKPTQRMNSSQVSLASEASNEQRSQQGDPVPSGNVGISTATNQQNVGPTHLSGLVCSVHRTTGQKPHALVGATTTTLGDKLYVFGGRLHSRSRPQLTSDLFELDLIKRHWKKIDALGDVPPPRYFHSVCALGDTKLVCYGGMSPSVRNPAASQTEPQPEVTVMSDIHIYDVTTRTWTQIATADPPPQGRYAHCAAILPSSAVFSSATAPLSAIHHNPPTSDNSGTLGVQVDGTGGAEMIVVGGQDSSNNYIEQINVFNLRNLKWTSATTWDRKCGAYKSMVVPMTGLSADLMGQNIPLDEPQFQPNGEATGTSMLVYSNYNFLDVKLELQIRKPDGTMIEKTMQGPNSPPGLRFPNGGILDNHFVVSGTYLTSSKHEYALWALDLKTLTWGRIDTNVSIFEQGSWNRGVLWNRRNTFVILGHRERSLVDDYNHRRINFSHVCMVELEAFGLYDNPRKTMPTSGYVSVSAPTLPQSVQSNSSSFQGGGRPYTTAAEQLGHAALMLNEISDMELVAIGGERLPCNSHILARRWGPYFNQLMSEAAVTQDNASVMISDGSTLHSNARSLASRNSSITITPSVANGIGPAGSLGTHDSLLDPQRSISRATARPVPAIELPNTTNVPASHRPRSLYLPHMFQTLQLLLQYLYTSSLPPVGAPLCTPHTLCSLLQMARPYQIDGLLEATVERLHEVLDGRNAAAVFNAAAMAAGGGRATGFNDGLAAYGNLGRRESEATTVGGAAGSLANLRITNSNGTTKTGADDKLQPNGITGRVNGHKKSDSLESASTGTSASASTTDLSQTDTESTQGDGEDGVGDKRREGTRQPWTGDVSSVIGLQKRGLRGLMEGRRMRERANTFDSGREERGEKGG